jgi:hypothetical protein
MKIQKFLLAALLCLAFTLSTEGLHAQGATYDSAIGLRLGRPLSISYKKFLSEEIAAEANIGYGSSWYNYGGLYLAAAVQKHGPLDIVDVDNFQWYIGAGVLADFDRNRAGIGAQGYFGIDYRAEDIPLNITLDLIPTFFLNDYYRIFAIYFSLGVRYILD